MLAMDRQIDDYFTAVAVSSLRYVPTAWRTWSPQGIGFVAPTCWGPVPMIYRVVLPGDAGFSFGVGRQKIAITRMRARLPVLESWSCVSGPSSATMALASNRSRLLGGRRIGSHSESATRGDGGAARHFCPRHDEMKGGEMDMSLDIDLRLRVATQIVVLVVVVVVVVVSRSSFG